MADTFIPLMDLETATDLAKRVIDLMGPAIKAGNPSGEIALKEDQILIAEVTLIGNVKKMIAHLEKMVDKKKLIVPENAGKGIYRLPDENQLIRIVVRSA
jgi:hypothetical protein